MNIKRLSSICLCTVLCAICLTGCGKTEIPNSDILGSNSLQSNSSYDNAETSIQFDTSSSSQISDGTSSIISSSSTSVNSVFSSVSTSNPVQSTSSSQSSVQRSEVSSSSSVHQHNYTVKTVAPTCAEVGYTVYTCSCGDQYTEDTVEALGHNYEQTIVEPTCTSSGYTLNTCTRCGVEHMDDYTNALGHNYSSLTVAPTCTERGYTLHTCLRCDSQYSDNIQSALGHNWSSWTVIREASASSEGERRRECSRCGETQSENIPQIINMNGYAAEVVNLVNAERAKYGLSPLTARSDLNEYAQLRSTEIVSNFAHKRPDGSSPLNYVMGLDGIHRSGENIAYGQKTPEAVMEAWMNSDGHRKNILSADYTMIGVGCYENGGRLYWTQIFAG